VNEPAFDELLRALIEAGTRFVLVGGFAVNAWGVVRGTKDLDIVADPEAENLRSLAATAVALGGSVSLGESLLGSERAILAQLVEGERTLITTGKGALDVIQGLPDLPGWPELVADSVPVPVAGVTVNVCSLAQLRRMKRAAGRTRDLADLEDLDAAHERD